MNLKYMIQLPGLNIDKRRRKRREYYRRQRLRRKQKAIKNFKSTLIPDDLGYFADLESDITEIDELEIAL